ncbi:MAG: recombination regulator RecX [Burkholderiales bacterium]|nr:recombination regulator RecX [Burkholderiales bacterium]
MADADSRNPEANRRTPTVSPKGRALRLLSLREYSRVELGRKLATHATPGDDVEALLDGLVTQGWLSDERAADSMVRQKSPQWGNARLKQALQAKGLPASVVAQALAQVPQEAGSEEVRAARVWQRKFGTPATDAATKAKHFRFLLARGFSAHAVGAVLKQAHLIASGEWPPS